MKIESKTEKERKEELEIMRRESEDIQNAGKKTGATAIESD